jgi:D-arabinose 1-dehydrogenase-like Zn-dependent alcohol dehydrogenase
MYDEFGATPRVCEVPDPVAAPAGAVIRVEATGLCRSDWHAWIGHEPGIPLPHVPGHELAGVVESVGGRVAGWHGGERVTVPFVCACGSCAECASGNQQVCARQVQPGFTCWGSFAEFVSIDHADVNLVSLPDEIDSAAAASLGCRFGTAYRAVLAQGRCAAGEWVAVHGCGGVGLSAVMVAAAAGASVVAVDVSAAALELASRFGAAATVDATSAPDVVSAVREATGGGAHLSLDALGSPATLANSVRCLRRRGRHVQVGLLPPKAGPVTVPMARVIAYELEILGSHGLAAHEYGGLLALVGAGRLRPDLLVTRRISLAEAPAALMAMGDSPGPGITVIAPAAGG